MLFQIFVINLVLFGAAIFRLYCSNIYNISTFIWIDNTMYDRNKFTAVDVGNDFLKAKSSSVWRVSTRAANTWLIDK